MIPLEYKCKHFKVDHRLHDFITDGRVVLSRGCRTNNDAAERGTREYNELVRTFYVGLAALQVGHDVQADSKLAQFTQLAPAEPAGWANWGVLALRQRNFDTANERIQRARSISMRTATRLFT